MRQEKTLKKDIDELKTEMEEISTQLKKHHDFKELKRLKTKYGKAKKKLAFLMMCLRYIQTNPSPDYINAEISKLSNRLLLINNNFGSFRPSVNIRSEKHRRTLYESEMGVSKIKEQIKTLEFIGK